MSSTVNSGASRKHKLEVRPDQPKTPSKPPLKSRDIKATPMKDPDNSLIHTSSQDLEGFVTALWPLLEAKFDTWMNNVMERTVSKKVELAVDSYVSSAEFQESLAESISFSFKSQVEEKLQKVEGLIEQSDSKSEVKYDDLEQYGRRNNIRFYGIKESELAEDTNKITLDVLSKLDLDISPNDICRSHRVGRKSSDPT